MRTINMLSSADMIKGQGVGSAFYEQVALVSEGLKETYQVFINAKQKCDIRHYHTLNPEFYMGMPLYKKSAANVGYVHFLPETVEESLDIPKPGRIIFYKYMIEFYRSLDYLVTVNPYFIKELEKYNIPLEKITYIPNYVSEAMFHPYLKDQIFMLKSRYEIPQNRFVVLGVGQVQTRKGIMDFIETAKALPEAYFIWAGGFSFGPMTEGYKELKSIMADPPENVNFIGIVERENMNDIYNIADVMFLPSYNELFPMTILESMCVGKPILLRDLDIYHDILFDYYLKGNSNEEFTQVIQNLASNPQFYSYWKEKSWKGHNFYSKDSVLGIWKNFYDKVYEESKERQYMVYLDKKKAKLEQTEWLQQSPAQFLNETLSKLYPKKKRTDERKQALPILRKYKTIMENLSIKQLAKKSKPDEKKEQ